jgi:hypothetical protein
MHHCTTTEFHSCKEELSQLIERQITDSTSARYAFSRIRLNFKGTSAATVALDVSNALKSIASQDYIERDIRKFTTSSHVHLPQMRLRTRLPVTKTRVFSWNDKRLVLRLFPYQSALQPGYKHVLLAFKISIKSSLKSRPSEL